MSLRFAPGRAGIINLWDYRDEEFVFVDGWLVLRGPNGSGKTKALEVLFPFVLDGRIDARRLNPFASEDRTMKSNLLYRGQEQSHAYAWMEFQRPVDPGPPDYVTIGIGLRAHRHQDKVTRYHFVTDGRVGIDFSLLDADDRPLNRRDLIRELGEDRVFDAPEDYRRAVDARLFGLGAARYEQMLDLVLTLRKPQLAKDLNPMELSRLLQRGLRPLDEKLVVEAASSFDDMEAVARTLDGLIAADQATGAFLAAYSTYLRTHAKAAGDTLSQRRAAVSQARTVLAEVTVEAETAQREVGAAILAIEEVKGEPGRLRTHLERLKSSTAYRSHEQLADLGRHVETLVKAVARAEETARREQSALDVRQRDLTAAEAAVADATLGLARLTRELADEAEEAGIEWSDADAHADGFVTRVNGRVIARRQDVGAVREHVELLRDAGRDRDRAAREVDVAQQQLEAAELGEREAEAAVDSERAATRLQATQWCGRHAALLDQLEIGDAAGHFLSTVDRVGESGAPTLKETFGALAATGTQRLRDRLSGLTLELQTLTTRRERIVEERDRIAAEHDDAPLPSRARPADRTGRPGAPMWRLVRFADGTPHERAAAIEAALEATGLLDAWIHPDMATTEHDGYLAPVPETQRPTSPTLADVLVPEAQDDVPAEVVQSILASIALRDEPGESLSAVVTGAGSYILGVLTGSHTKAVPEYVGATARAARRAIRIAECDRLIEELDHDVASVGATLGEVRQALSTIDEAAGDLPSLDTVLNALRRLHVAAHTLKLRRDAHQSATARLDQSIAEQAAAAAALRKTTAERALPVERLEVVADALRRFENAALRLPPARDKLASGSDSLVGATTRHAEAVGRVEEAQDAIVEATLAHRDKQEAYETLASAIGESDVQRTLTEVAETERKIEAVDACLEERRSGLTAAAARRAAADKGVEGAHATLTVAITEAQNQSLALRPFAQPDLLSLLKCPTQLRWPTSEELSSSTPLELNQAVVALHEAILAATKELTPTESSLKQANTRLNIGFNQLQSDLQATGLDHRPEFNYEDNIVVVRVADEQGMTPVAFFAERIGRDRQDQEQLLSEAERRVFEDALLTQLARQIHHRTIDARELVERMDAQMRSRRMSSGLTVGVGWQLSDDLDQQQREICKMLDRDPVRLGPDQLATLRRHFAGRIKAARQMAPDQPYRELLAQVLDYRQWRGFAFTLHRPGGINEPLTRSRHSQLSGGEQSVSLHLPLFAAANALFSSARPEAPRLLGLDEAFAGVDANGRGELMSLAKQFDLDLFMTGFDLWATHNTVTGAAHYDLSHSVLEHTVSMVLVAWNGSVRTADFDGTLARALGSPETRRVPVEAA